MDIPPPDPLARAAPAPAITPAGQSSTPLLEATVLAARPQLATTAGLGFLLDIDLGGERLEAASARELPPGTRILLRQLAPQRFRVERLEATPANLRAARVAEALRQDMPRQLPLREAVQAVAALAESTALPQVVRQAVTSLLPRLPTTQQVQDAQGLRAALQESGSFFEARLRRVLQQAVSGPRPASPAPGARTHAPGLATAATAWAALRRAYGALAGVIPGRREAALAQPADATMPTPPVPARTLPSGGTTSDAARSTAPGPRGSDPPVGTPERPISTQAATIAGPQGTAPRAAMPVPAPPAPMATTPMSPAPATLPPPRDGAAVSAHEAMPSVPPPVTPRVPAPVAGGSGAPAAHAMSAVTPGPATTTQRGAPPAPGTAPPSPPRTDPMPGATARVAPPLATARTPATTLTDTVVAPPATRDVVPATATVRPQAAAAGAVTRGTPAAGTPAQVPRSPQPAQPFAGTEPADAGAVLASDLKAQWQGLRALLAGWLRQHPAPRAVPTTTDTAPRPEAPAQDPRLYTASGQVEGKSRPQPVAGRVDAQSPTPPAARDLVERVLQQVEGALARTRVQQLSALPEGRPGDAPATPAWIAEIPLLHPRGVDSLQLRIEDHQAPGRALSEDRRWQVMMVLDGESLGTLHALVLLAGRRLQATLWAERASTLHAARAALGELGLALGAVGVEVTRLECMPGRPPPGITPAQERLLDVRT